ncbi:MAG TPA: triose-phosphate isomerase [Bacteroidia bacterium]|jgi:triosephosphate isomerase|nr:triose-phosphate isomerase [Bacteroidia bacterium]
MRKKIVAGNWKMNKTYSEAIPLLYEIKDLLFKSKKAETVIKVIAPPFPYIHDFYEITKGIKNLFISSQNCASEESGAYTGEVSAAMIKSVGASYIIIGHSERRIYYKESSEELKKKVDITLKNSLTSIFCIGESAEKRKANEQFAVAESQISKSLFHLPNEDFKKLVLAYEPVWAIGTGLTATSAQAQEMHHFIRSIIEKKYGKETAEIIPILYGGSCNAKNAPELFSCPDVDGGLIGGAALKAAEFVEIIHSVPQ